MENLLRHTTISSRSIDNVNISLPSIKDLWWACYKNYKRNAFNNVAFLQHLKGTHQNIDDINIDYSSSLQRLENNNIKYNHV